MFEGAWAQGPQVAPPNFYFGLPNFYFGLTILGWALGTAGVQFFFRRRRTDRTDRTEHTEQKIYRPYRPKAAVIAEADLRVRKNIQNIWKHQQTSRKLLERAERNLQTVRNTAR